MLTIMLNCLTF